MRVRAAALAAIAVLVIVPLTGCGGDSDDATRSEGETGTATSASASKTAFIKEADAICAKAGKKTEAEFAAFAKKNGFGEGTPPTAAQYAGVGKTIVIPALERQVDEIAELSPPAADEDLIDGFLGAVEDAIQKAEAEPQTAGQSPETLLTKADKLVDDYGFKVCGQR